MPQIRVKNGPQKGKTFTLDAAKPIVMGRDPTTTVQITDKGVSREHAEIFRVGEMVFIRDLGSRNGTFVNDEQIEEELLRQGDQVRVGSTILVFESGDMARQDEVVQYDEGGEVKTSLELKVEDLFVGDGAVPREGEHFRAVCQSTKILTSERDEKALFDKLLTLIMEHVPADHLYIFVKEDGGGPVLPRAVRQREEGSSVPVSRTILKRVLSESRAILTADAMADERFRTGDSIVLNQIRSVLCAPVLSGAGVQGAIYAVNARLAETFDQADLELLTAIGTQLGFALENLGLTRGRRRMFLAVISRLVDALETEIPGLKGHSERVGMYSAAVARELNLSEREAMYVHLAGLLHDVGKLKAAGWRGAPDDPAHATKGAEFIRDLPGLDDVLPIVRAHHERLDGTGKPAGLKADSIPIGARIVAVANAFDHLLFDNVSISQSSGKPKQPDAAAVRRALTVLQDRCKGEFDDSVVKALMVAFRHGAVFPTQAGHTNPNLNPMPAEAFEETQRSDSFRAVKAIVSLQEDTPSSPKAAKKPPKSED